MFRSDDDEALLPDHQRSGVASSSSAEHANGAPAVRARRLNDAQVLQIAESLRAEAGASHQSDPRVFAYRLGIAVVPGFPEAGELSTATEAVFTWHHDRRERGIRIYCALARSLFLARRIEHGADDVWALAIELALPTQERWNGRMMLIYTQRFCPESVICAYVSDT